MLAPALALLLPLLSLCRTSLGQYSSDQCSWRGSGLTHEGHARDVEQVYLRCSQGSLEWLYPTGAIIVNLRPNTVSAAAARLSVCIKPAAESRGTNIYLDRSGKLRLLLREERQAQSKVQCFGIQEGALFIEAVPHMDISRRITAFQYELVSGRLGPDGHSLDGKAAGQSEVAAVEKFGFSVTTCCGYLPLQNEWQDDWVTFYSQQRLQHQLNILEKSYGDREARELWAELQLKIPQYFRDVEIVPALLHGDLWGGNVAECADGPVIFDPSSFYGHSEFELSIAGMFGGFNNCFYSAYHEKIPQAPGFTKRKQLYLFHYLNHWNHFGGGYRGSSIRIMKDLLK